MLEKRPNEKATKLTTNRQGCQSKTSKHKRKQWVCLKILNMALCSVSQWLRICFVFVKHQQLAMVTCAVSLMINLYKCLPPNITCTRHHFGKSRWYNCISGIEFIACLLFAAISISVYCFFSLAFTHIKTIWYNWCVKTWALYGRAETLTSAQRQTTIRPG